MFLNILCFRHNDVKYFVFTQFDSKCHIISGCDIMIITDFPDYPTTPATSSFINKGAGGNNGLMYTHVVHLAAAISMAKSMRDLDKYKRVNYGGLRKVFNWIRGY